MKAINKYIRISLCSFFFIIVGKNSACAQCNNGAQWPAETVNVTCGANTIVSNIFAGEYNVTKGYMDDSYLTFTSSTSSDYITIRKASDNTLLGHGISPVSIMYYAVYDSLEMHINTSGACGTENSTRIANVYMVCCNNSFQYPSNDVSLTLGSNTITTSQYAGDYNVTTGYVDGSLCIYTSSVPTDFITLRKASDNIVLASGFSPLPFTYQAAMGSIEMHINTDVTCGIENVNRTTTVFMDYSIYKGGDGDGFSQLAYAQADNPSLAIYKGGMDDGFTELAYAQADNPLLAVYKGGMDDGYTHVEYSQADTPIFAIYKGGMDDGFTYGDYAQADNPILAIYKGGMDDGFTQFNYAQADNPLLLAIYQGGMDDGFSQLDFAQADNPLLLAIYQGGMDDGFSQYAFAQSDNAIVGIYKGGIDDGFTFMNFAQADLPLESIFKGGMDDGFSHMNFVQADNAIVGIYKGGNDDGFTLAFYEQCDGTLTRWLGNVSIDWHTASNWECGLLPTINSDVIIPGGATFFPTVSANDEIRSLLMKPGSSLIIVPSAVLKLNGDQ
jgi:hypothetical protein